MPESYSLVADVKDQIKALVKYGHDVVFYAQEGCDGKGIDCEVRAILPHFRLEKDVESVEAKKKLVEIFEKELKDFDVVIEHDLIYLRQYFTYRKAIMEAKLPNVKWVHWAHSFINGVSIKMPKSKYVYMNYIDVSRFAKSIGVEVDDVRVVFNDKDARLFFDWDNISKQVAEKYDVMNADIMQTYPLCTTRWNSKGIDHVIKIFGKLKKLDNKVMLVFCNANARKLAEEVDNKLKMAYAEGLTEREICCTSTISPETVGGVPRRVVRDLMQVSNLFIFPSVSEVCSNALLEASMSKQLLVLNKDFPAMFDFGEDGKTCLSYNFGSLVRTGYRYRNSDSYMEVAKVIHQHLEHSKSNQQFLKIKKACNIDTIYKKQLLPLLYEDY